jgi:MYXO-CTERM domain-containing protein
MRLVPLLALALPGIAYAGPGFIDQGFVLSAPASGSFTGGIGAPTVDYDVASGTYVMYFESPPATPPAECNTSFAIGRATSPDGINWTLDAEPVIAPDVGTAGSPFHCVASQPSVVYDGATWHLFFSMASEPASAGQPNTGNGIGYATSTDGVNFTVQDAPLIPDEGVSMGLSSAAIVDGNLYLLYVWYPDFKLAWKPLSGGTWTVEDTPVVDHDDVGVWAIEWVLGPSLFCEDDQADPFSLVFGGDDHDGVRNLAYGHSADATTWAYDADNPITTGDLDYTSLKHWDVLEAGTDYQMWYSKDDPSTGVKGVGYAVTGYEMGPTGPRMCPHPAPPVEDTGDTGSTTTPGDDTGSTAETGQLQGGKDKCGCATGTPGPAGLAALLAVLAIRRRRV